MTRQRFLTLAVLAVAFATRVFRLDGQSLWGDEAISVSRATESLLSITQTAPHEGTLPPLYYYLLHFWQPMVGTTEFAVRYLSLLFGVLTVAVLYAAVRTSSGHRPAVLASALASISPFWVYYSQETRMYALATLLSLSSTWIFLRIVQRPRRAITPSIWMGYVLVSSLAVFSHYFAGFVLLAQNVVAGARLAGDAATVIRFAPHEPGALRRKCPLAARGRA